MTSPARGRDSSQSDSAILAEMLSRVRRIETRMTSGFIELGVSVTAQKPEFHPAGGNQQARVDVPSRHSSLSEIMACVPQDHDGPIQVFVGSDRIAVVSL